MIPLWAYCIFFFFLYISFFNIVFLTHIFRIFDGMIMLYFFDI